MSNCLGGVVCNSEMVGDPMGNVQFGGRSSSLVVWIQIEEAQRKDRESHSSYNLLVNLKTYE
ncbi:unnamed protein product [Camellia sinensis]